MTEKNINGISMPTRPRTFEDFWEQSMNSEQNLKMKYMVNRKDWINALKENKTEKIVDKIPSEELPQCEDFEHSKVGDFISQSDFQDLYDDEQSQIWEGLKEGVLCYHSASGEQSWWQLKGGDGLVRIK